MAKLYFRYGAMNSGKSTALLQAAFNYEERGHEVLLAKPSIDTKGDRDIVSRLGVVRGVDFTIAPDSSVLDIFQQHRNRIIEDHGRDVSCLLVDEAQFLSSEQVDDLLRIALIDDVPVLAYGIRTDFQTVAFPGSRRLLELSHSLEELKTICRCGRKAIFNGRRINGVFVFDGAQVAIDGELVTYEFSIGRGTFINRRCFFDLSAPVTIGRDVSVGMGVLFVTSTHEIGGPERRAGAAVALPIQVGDGSWIGAGARLLPGVRVGEGCVVAAGAVVAGDCEPNSLYAGVPARLIRKFTPASALPDMELAADE